MDYLIENLPTYQYEHRDEKGNVRYVQRFRWDEVEHDEDEGPMAEVNGAWVHLRSGDDVPASWWTVGVYTAYQVYGGPEEGGWWYQAGSLTEHGRLRFFDDYEEAKEYGYRLWQWVGEKNANRDRGDEKLTVRCTTNALPGDHYPRKRPHYS